MIAQESRLEWKKRSREREVCSLNKPRDRGTGFRDTRTENVRSKVKDTVPEVGTPEGNFHSSLLSSLRVSPGPSWLLSRAYQEH